MLLLQPGDSQRIRTGSSLPGVGSEAFPSSETGEPKVGCGIDTLPLPPSWAGEIDTTGEEGGFATLSFPSSETGEPEVGVERARRDAMRISGRCSWTSVFREYLQGEIDVSGDYDFRCAVS